VRRAIYFGSPGVPIIAIDNLTHRYAADRVALDSVSLDVNERDIFGFLGPNGSGKTTLFRILSTLAPPQSGRVTVLDHDLATSRDAVRSEIGVVFQSPSLDKQLTAEENLRHHGHLYGLRGAELRSRIDAMLTRFGLADRRRELVKSFSGGMKRRVELAKGLLTSPRILLMDEPSTGLDPTARIEMWKSLTETRQRDNVTILVTTHLMDEGDRCDRLAIMDRGRIVATGTPTQLKDRIGGDVITLTSGDPAALRETISHRFTDVTVEQVNGSLRIERHRAHEFVPLLVEAAPGMIESVSIGKPTLEDVFIHVTGRGFRDQNDA
jgi:ABC-2 type transport system ATP-binding protein